MVSPLLRMVLIILLAQNAQALTSDHEQTMHFSANSADINQTTHHGIYIGAVELDQGSTHIRAAYAETDTNQQNQLIKAIIKGDKETQAHYWTSTTLDKPPIHAYADVIYYFPTQHLITLIGNARVLQGRDSFAAAEIRYDTLDQHVISNSKGPSRTSIIIHPGKPS